MKKPLYLVLAFASSLIFSHGTDKLGPNGGYIQMPGSFHTELVPVDDQSVKIFLLDQNFKNPQSNNSSVEVTAKLESNKEEKLSCESQDKYFKCFFGGSTSLKNTKELLVNAKRNSLKGKVATYKIPLKLTGATHH